MKAQIITIGDEILIGQILDTNSAWIAQQLNMAGITVAEMKSVSDTREAILEALKAAQSADLVLLTGGLGPTKDDITKKVLAEYFGVQLTFHEKTYNRIAAYFEKRSFTLTPAHREQCYMPANAEILVNDMGTAPGMWMQKNNTIFVSMPGVPYEMKHLITERVLPRLRGNTRLRPILHRTILTAGTGESVIAQRIEAFENNLPDFVKLAYLPNLGIVRLRLTTTGNDEAALNQILDEKKFEIQTLIPEFVFGEERETLEEVIGRILTQKGATLGTAESCTGGYIAHKITSIAGSSTYFGGSVVTYSNKLKIKLLNVNPDTLKAHGAVSEQTVREMVAGALDALGVDYAIAVSGIAGPGGGTPEKPVGTIWTAVGNRQEIITKKLTLTKYRIRNIQLTTNLTLNLLRKFVDS